MQLLVGTYSFDLDGQEGGEGIYSVGFDNRTGAFGPAKLLAKCANPSAMLLSADGSILFAVREVFARAMPGVTSYRVGTFGELTELSSVSINGELPCHLAFDPMSKRLASAQYGSGDVAIYVTKGGFLATPTYQTSSGSGPNTARQESPHVHCVAFTDNGEVLHWIDLGTDSIISQRLRGDDRVVETSSTSTPPGSGPRHTVINQDATKAWIICELDESMLTLDRAGLGWRITDVVPAFHKPSDAEGAGAAIRITQDERFLYASGRRQSCIAGFSQSGESIGEFSSGGQWPRDFIISSDDKWVIAANERSNSLTSLRRDTGTGALALTGFTCDVAKPVSLVELST